MPVILASASPRRVQLLTRLGVKFSQRPADIDESVMAGEEASDYVVRLAREKAASCQAQVNDADVVVLAADTCVVLDQQILGKPVDRMDALAMLARLGGREHRVLTGVCLAAGDRVEELLCETRVQFVSLQREAVEAYIDSGEPFDKAGGYGIQGLGGAFVESIVGSYSNVVGLPLAQTWQLLADFGVATALQGALDE
ncbi:septum formation inhibitor Maf [Halieaceae bacterium IMCC14734]|uniref:dTTP/UTP pyrophosphatase n=1 Tax=Candidatus Litorirhabdus singularis TaxID=2518993 RepID=A0ABT3TJG7_9GAMM|nr:Maf family protein [Candidatus Litorirhabdus singularis]MCX2982466.1 septum formation inhibitor Maf [Candidatus Litorirhabdus singularis]